MLQQPLKFPTFTTYIEHMQTQTPSTHICTETQTNVRCIHMHKLHKIIYSCIQSITCTHICTHKHVYNHTLKFTNNLHMHQYMHTQTYYIYNLLSCEWGGKTTYIIISIFSWLFLQASIHTQEVCSPPNLGDHNLTLGVSGYNRAQQSGMHVYMLISWKTISIGRKLVN